LLSGRLTQPLQAPSVKCLWTLPDKALTQGQRHRVAAKLLLLAMLRAPAQVTALVPARVPVLVVLLRATAVMAALALLLLLAVMAVRVLVMAVLLVMVVWVLVMVLGGPAVAWPTLLAAVCKATLLWFLPTS
jgi:hypothetical protein